MLFITYVSPTLVLVATIAAQAMGFLWYSDALFGKEWRRLMDLSDKKMKSMKKDMAPKMLLGAALTLLQAYVLAFLLRMLDVNDIQTALVFGGLMWIGFVNPSILMNFIYGGKPLKLIVIDSSYQLASLMVMATIVVGLG